MTCFWVVELQSQQLVLQLPNGRIGKLVVCGFFINSVRMITRNE